MIPPWLCMMSRLRREALSEMLHSILPKLSIGSLSLPHSLFPFPSLFSPLFTSCSPPSHLFLAPFSSTLLSQSSAPHSLTLPPISLPLPHTSHVSSFSQGWDDTGRAGAGRKMCLLTCSCVHTNSSGQLLWNTHGRHEWRIMTDDGMLIAQREVS